MDFIAVQEHLTPQMQTQERSVCWTAMDKYNYIGHAHSLWKWVLHSLSVWTVSFNQLPWSSTSPKIWPIKQPAQDPEWGIRGSSLFSAWLCVCSELNGSNLGGSEDIYCEKQLGNHQSNCSGLMYVFLMSLTAEGLIQCLCYLHRTALSVKGLIISSVFVSVSFSLATLKFSVACVFLLFL